MSVLLGRTQETRFDSLCRKLGWDLWRIEFLETICPSRSGLQRPHAKGWTDKYSQWLRFRRIRRRVRCTWLELFCKPLRVSKSSLDKKASHNSLDVGANLFVGNVEEGVDENILYDTCSSFGTIIKPPRIMRNNMTTESKGFGFVSFDSFQTSDMGIEWYTISTSASDKVLPSMLWKIRSI